jgi:methylase of polypeptide subunit release factors
MKDLNALFAQAVALQNQGAWAEAVALYRDLEKARSGLAPVSWNLGLCLKAQGQWLEALKAFQRTGKADPTMKGLAFMMGMMQQKLGRMEEAVVSFSKAVDAEPENGDNRFNLAAAYRALGRLEEAIEEIDVCLQLQPGNREAQLLQTKLRTAMLPVWHVPMVNDAPRNDAYEAAIKASVRPGDLVLEIGTGSGLLAMMAARAGAMVVTCEATPWIARAARQVIAANGLADRITVINALSSDVRIGPGGLPRPADVLLSEIVASDFLSERILPAVNDAKARLLAPGARIIPERGGVYCALAGGESLEKHTFVGKVNGFDLNAFNALYPRCVRFDARTVQPVPLSAQATPFTFDFTTKASAVPAALSFALTATAAGRCCALAQWVWLDFGSGIVFENSPFVDAPASGWQPGFYLPTAPFDLAAGDVVNIEAMQDGFNVWLAFA